MSSAYRDDTSQETLQVCEWESMRYLTGTNSVRQDMEAMGEGSMCRRHAESGTNQNIAYLLTGGCRYLAQQYFYKPTHHLHTPSAHSSAIGSRTYSVQCGDQSCLICFHSHPVHGALALFLCCGLDI